MMKRSLFLKKLSSLGLLSLSAPQVASAAALREADQQRTELLAAWQRSETMTLTNVEQMPPELFTFRYTDEAMTFSEQWRHCVVYTCSQLASRAGLQNPYQNVKLPVQMPKEDVIKELKNMYAFVRQSIQFYLSSKIIRPFLSVC